MLIYSYSWMNLNITLKILISSVYVPITLYQTTTINRKLFWVTFTVWGTCSCSGSVFKGLRAISQHCYQHKNAWIRFRIMKTSHLKTVLGPTPNMSYKLYKCTSHNRQYSEMNRPMLYCLKNHSQYIQTSGFLTWPLKVSLTKPIKTIFLSNFQVSRFNIKWQLWEQFTIQPI